MNILIYDSDKNVQFSLKRFVEALGHNGLIANTPISILLTPHTQSYDVIISEYFTDGGNFLRLFKMIKMKKPHVQIIVLTALNYDLEKIQPLQDLGIKHIFQKPVDPKTISETIQSISYEQTELKASSKNMVNL